MAARLPLPHALTPVCSRPLRQRVLIIAANDVVTAAAELATRLGHHARSAATGSQALGMALAFRPHVILVDVDVAGMAGAELIRALRRRGDTPPPRLIAITDLPLAQESRSEFDQQLVKPLAMESLMSALDSSYAGRGRGRHEGDGPGTPSSVRSLLIAAADRAVVDADGAGLASAVLPLLGIAAEDLAFELVAVIELARHDLELAALRWSHLRQKL